MLAWQVKRIDVLTQNDKRLPDLRSLLQRQKREQTPEEIKAILLAGFGIVPKARKEKVN